MKTLNQVASTRCSGDNKEILPRNTRSEHASDFCYDRKFALRLADIAKQNWKSDTDAHSKRSTNGEIKSLLEPEKYLKEIDNYFVHRQTVKFGISDLSFMIEKGRQHRMLREERICKQCDIRCIEAEFHFLLVCPQYKDLREQYLPKYHTNNPNLSKFVDILHSNNGPFISTTALKCVMALEKAVKIYHWAFQRGLVGCPCGLALEWLRG